MRASGIEDIRTYIYRWHKTAAQYIATPPILDLCLDTDKRPGSRTLTRWWEQKGMVFPWRTDEGREGGYCGGYREKVRGGDEKEYKVYGILYQHINHGDGS